MAPPDSHSREVANARRFFLLIQAREDTIHTTESHELP